MSANEFVCADCGESVISLPARDPPPTICAFCAHLREFVADPLEREAIRRHACVKDGLNVVYESMQDKDALAGLGRKR